MNLTPAQQRAIAHRGSSLLVSASAGSGKTEVLARRCVSLLVDTAAPCEVERLLVVTFTRAAAAELRVRVARMLRAAAAQTRDAASRRHLRRQELLVDAAEIGTIDAWCGRLVREHFAAAGVDVAFTTLSAEEAALLRGEVLDMLFERVHRGGDELAAAARRWIARGPTPDDAFLRRLVAQLNAFREHLVNPGPWFERQRARLAGEATAEAERLLAAALRAECLFQGEQLAALPDGGAAALMGYAAALSDWAERLRDPGRLLDVVRELGAFKLAKPGRNAGGEPAVIGSIRKRWLEERLQEAWSADGVSAMLEHAGLVQQWLGTLLELEAEYHRMLSEAKSRQAAYEFGDILRMALDVLGEPEGDAGRRPTAVARQLQQRYEHILVDEYQDTSPIQVEILRLVTRDAPGRTNRFMVGDLKQSIYGFREAEPRLFAELAAAFRAGRAEGRVEFLSDNFRSHGELLEGLNRIFARLFDPALGGTSYGPEERLRAGRAADELPNPTLPGPRLAVHVIEAERGGSDSDSEALEIDRIEREAALAAERMQALLAAGARVADRGPDQRPLLRPLRLADMVILLRSARHRVGHVARVLRACGIPCVTSGREALLDSLEVGDVRCVLELLVNRRQDVPLAAYLRGPLVGLTAAELWEIRAGIEGAAIEAPGEESGARASLSSALPPALDPPADFFEAVRRYCAARPDPALAARLDAALEQLAGWATAAREEELPAVVRRILRDGALEHFSAGLKDGPQRVAQLRSLVSLADSFAAAQHGGVAEFVEYLRRMEAEEVDPGALATGDEDVVRILTIHAAKGLEFPVVFLLGAGSPWNRQSKTASLRCDEALGASLAFRDYPTRRRLKGARYHVLGQRTVQRDLEEELRLLYVAATRAREQLFIVGHAPPGTWAAQCEQYGGREPPLLARLSAASRLEWVLMAAAGELGDIDARSRWLAVTVHEPTTIAVPEPAAVVQVAPLRPPAEADGEEAWVARGRALLAANRGRAAQDLPGLLSVSAAKERVTREWAAEQPRAMDQGRLALRRPRLGVGACAEGNEIGTACHRFLECADLSVLGDAAAVRRQVAAQVAAGRLLPEQAELVPVDDVAWLFGEPEGRLLAESARDVRREVPFVYGLPLGAGGERVVVRGIIDALVDTPAGLVIVDYKTDRPRDADDWAARLAGYGLQVRVYAQAAGAIFDRPVHRCVLALLSARRIESVAAVPVTADELLPAPDRRVVA